MSFTQAQLAVLEILEPAALIEYASRRCLLQFFPNAVVLVCTEPTNPGVPEFAVGILGDNSNLLLAWDTEVYPLDAIWDTTRVRLTEGSPTVVSKDLWVEYADADDHV